MTGNVFPWVGDVMDIVIAMIQKMKKIVKVEDPFIYFSCGLSNYTFFNGYFLIHLCREGDYQNNCYQRSNDGIIINNTKNNEMGFNNGFKHRLEI